MSVVLREKPIDQKRVSLYLDIYHNKKRSYEFLNIHISGKRLSDEDKEKKEVAEKIRSQREYELLVQENGLVDKKKSKADVVVFLEKLSREGKNETSYLRVLSRLKEYCEGESLIFNDLTYEWLTSFQKWLQSYMKHNSAAYVMNAFKTAMNRAIEEKIIKHNPLNEIPKSQRLRNKPTKRIHIDIRELRILANTKTKKVHPQVKQGYFLSAFCGMRWSDIFPLKWTDISTKEIGGKETWVINFQQEKTEDIEYLPLSGQAIKILKERKEEAAELKDTSAFVFPKLIGKNPKYKRGNYDFARKQLKKWAKQARISKNLTFHTGRHTFATMSLDQGIDLYTVSKLLGHRDIKTTTVYAKVSDQKKYEAVSRIPDLGLTQEKNAAKRKPGKRKSR